MALALNLHEKLFAAIEEQFANDGDMLQLVPNQLYRDFLPKKDSEGNEMRYPAVVVSQGAEGGTTEHAAVAAGMEAGEDVFLINFEVVAKAVRDASQIVWQIVQVFKTWHGSYPGVSIKSTSRIGPPWAGMTDDGECLASVGFMVSATADEE